MFNQANLLACIFACVIFFANNDALANTNDNVSKNNRPHEYIVVFKSDTDNDQIETIKDEIEQANGQGQRPLKSFRLFKGFSGKIPPGQLQKLEKNNQIKTIETNESFTLSTEGSPVDTGSWGLDRIDQISLPLDGIYKPQADGYGTHVYVVDTGIRLSHDEFAGRADWVFTASDVTGGNDDKSGHGTLVAGIIAGQDYGVAKGAWLHSVKVADHKGSGSVAGLIEGIEYVALNHLKPAVAVISPSVSYSQTLNNTIEAAIARGVTVVTSAGDVIRDGCNYSPGSANGSINVGASAIDDSVADASNFGACVDLFAPGLYINSAWYTADFHNNSLSHSPAAAAHTAGVAAIILGQDRSCTVSQVKEQILAHSQKDILSLLRGDDSNNVLLGLASEPTQCNIVEAEYDHLVKVSNDQSVILDFAHGQIGQPLVNGGLTYDAESGGYLYTPNTGFVGVDSFTYVDANGDERTVRIEVALLVNSGGYYRGSIHNRHPKVTALSNGDYLLSNVDNGSLYYQRYTRFHQPINDNLRWGNYSNSQYDIEADIQGGYIITTMSVLSTKIHIRGFDANNSTVWSLDLSDASEPTMSTLSNSYRVIGFYQPSTARWMARVNQENNNYVTTAQLFDGATDYTQVTIHQMQDGGFMAVGLKANSQVMMQRYDHLGQPMGEIQPVSLVNTGVITDEMFQFDILELTNGTIVIGWSSTGGQDNSGNAAMARMFNRDGAPLTDELLLNQYTNSDQRWLRLAPRPAGGFVAVYQSLYADGDSWGVMAREFGPQGQVMSDGFRVAGEYIGHQRFPSIAQLTDGQLVVTLTDGSSGQEKTLVSSLALPTDNDDIIHGNNQNNILRGGGGDNTLYGHGGDDHIYDANLGYGGSGNDKFWRSLIVFAGSGNDEVYISRGANSIDGGDGFDLVYFTGAFADYTINNNGSGSFIITDNRKGSPDGTNYLNGVEVAQFSDWREILDLDTYTPVDYSHDNTVKILTDQATALPFVITVVTNPSNGHLEYDSATDSYLYTPNTGFVGVDSFTYIDANGDERTVRIEVALLTNGGGYYRGSNNTHPKVTALSNGDYLLSNIDNGTLYYQRFNRFHQPKGDSHYWGTMANYQYDIEADLQGGYVIVSTFGSTFYIRGFDAHDSTVWSLNLNNINQSTVSILSNSYRVIGYYQPSMANWFARIHQENNDYVHTAVLFHGATDYAQVTIHQMQDGGFMAVGLKANSQVMMQRYDHLGQPMGEIQPVSLVNTGVITDEMFQFDILELTNGTIVIGWSSTGGQDNSGNAAMARMFSRDGAPLTDELLLNQYTNRDQMSVRLAPRPAGGFVAVYQSLHVDGSGWGVMAREFGPQGQVMSDGFRVAGEYIGHQRFPSIAQLTDGQLIVTLTDGSSGQEKTLVSSLALPTDNDDIIHGNNQNNILRGGGGDNTLYGHGGDDHIYDANLGYGGSGNDIFYRGHTLFGEAGNDHFYGGAVIDGGEGIDVLHLQDQSLDHVITHHGDGTFTVTDIRDNAPNGIILLQNVESIQFTDLTMNL